MLEELKFLKDKALKVKQVIGINSLYWAGLLLTLFVAYFIRTRNLVYLKGKYLIGLDPDLFYRYSAHILQYGSMMAQDMLRYFPTGYTPMPADSFFAYVMAYGYKLISWTGATLMQFYIIYPVIAGLIGFVFLFLFMRELFGNKAAIITTAFCAVIPAYIFRTGAGFADHDAMAMMWMFASLYFFALAWREPKVNEGSAIIKLFQTATPSIKEIIKTNWKWVLFSAISGTFAGFMALTWGGYKILYAGIGLLIPAAILFTKIKPWKLYAFFVWTFFACLFTYIRFEHMGFVYSPEIMLLLFSSLIAGIYLLANKFEKLIPPKLLNFAPKECWTIVAAAVIGFIGAEIIGFNVIMLVERMFYPSQSSRLGYTISENMTPYFTGGSGWVGSFGATVWLILIASVIMFYFMFRKPWKYSIPLTGLWTVSMFAIIFGNYAPGSKINTIFSNTYVYILTAFALALIGVYLYTYNKDKESFTKLFDTKWQMLFVFLLFVFSLFIAKRMIRMMFSFVPIAVIVLGFVMSQLIDELWASKKRITVAILCVIMIVCLVGNVQGSLEVNRGSGSGFPGQWESAISFVKTNTPEDAVFAHWWDYGYWLQTEGERATVVDGGNVMAWDHYMGRLGLLGKNPEEYLSYLKTFGVTHLLISGEEIGKFSAFSTIGSDENMDLQSTIGIFNLAETQEMRDGVKLAYKGYWDLDKDYVVDKKVLEQGKVALAAVTVDFNNDGKIGNPIGVFYDGKNQFSIPISCVCIEGQCSNSENVSGINGCFVIVPALTNSTSGNQVGAGFFVSEKIVDTNLVQMYIIGKENPHFKLVYDDKTPLALYQGRLIGPIKIWEVQYPEGVQINESYLEPSEYG